MNIKNKKFVTGLSVIFLIFIIFFLFINLNNYLKTDIFTLDLEEELVCNEICNINNDMCKDALECTEIEVNEFMSSYMCRSPECPDKEECKCSLEPEEKLGCNEVCNINNDMCKDALECTEIEVNEFMSSYMCRSPECPDKEECKCSLEPEEKLGCNEVCNINNDMCKDALECTEIEINEFMSSYMCRSPECPDKEECKCSLEPEEKLGCNEVCNINNDMCKDVLECTEITVNEFMSSYMCRSPECPDKEECKCFEEEDIEEEDIEDEYDDILIVSDMKVILEQNEPKIFELEIDDNDIDEDIEIIISQFPTKGLLTRVNTNNNSNKLYMQYTPSLNYVGLDEAEYKIINKENSSDTAKIEFEILKNINCNLNVNANPNSMNIPYNQNTNINFNFNLQGSNCSFSDCDIYIALAETRDKAQTQARTGRGEFCNEFGSSSILCRVKINNRNFTYTFDKDWYYYIEDYANNDYYLGWYADCQDIVYRGSFGRYKTSSIPEKAKNMFITTDFFIIPYSLKENISIEILNKFSNIEYKFKSSNESILNIDNQGVLSINRESGGLVNIEVIDSKNKIQKKLDILVCARGDLNCDGKVNVYDQNDVVVGWTGN